MKLRIKKKCNWSINYKTVDFNINQIISSPEDVSEQTAKEMIEADYADDFNMRPTKETLVEENKAIESTQENKQSESPLVECFERKRGRPPKGFGLKAPHVPLSGQTRFE